MYTDLIDRAIELCLRKRKSLEVLHRYIRLKYKIHIDRKILLKRISASENLKLA
jgi:hypothetical protein